MWRGGKLGELIGDRTGAGRDVEREGSGQRIVIGQEIRAGGRRRRGSLYALRVLPGCQALNGPTGQIDIHQLDRFLVGRQLAQIDETNRKGVLCHGHHHAGSVRLHLVLHLLAQRSAQLLFEQLRDRVVMFEPVATEEKSNEITAIPQLLDLIDVEDAIVTIDAAGCQKNIAAQIVNGKGDYVLALKGNQGKLFDDVRWLLDCHLRDDFADCPVSRYVEAEEGHGRLEERRYYQMTAPDYLSGRSAWKGLKTIGAAVRICHENGVQTTDTRYFLSSLRRNGKQFANAVRNHWAIENTLHWSLDMTYREDESRVRQRTFADNLSWLRRLTLSLIKQHPGKQSNIMKRRMAGWSVDFLMQILTGKGS